MEIMLPHVIFFGIEYSMKNEYMGKTPSKGKGKTLAPKSDHYGLLHCNIRVTQDLFRLHFIHRNTLGFLI